MKLTKSQREDKRIVAIRAVMANRSKAVDDANRAAKDAVDAIWRWHDQQQEGEPPVVDFEVRTVRP